MKLNVGPKLRMIREDRKLSQKALAELVGVGAATIYRIEHGDQTVAFETMAKVCEELGVRIRFKATHI